MPVSWAIDSLLDFLADLLADFLASLLVGLLVGLLEENKDKDLGRAEPERKKNKEGEQCKEGAAMRGYQRPTPHIKGTLTPFRVVPAAQGCRRNHPERP